MSYSESGSNIGLAALVVGVRIKTDYALLLASQDGDELGALSKRAIEVEAMVELLELAREPHLASIEWLYKQQRWIIKQIEQLVAVG